MRYGFPCSDSRIPRGSPTPGHHAGGRQGPGPERGPSGETRVGGGRPSPWASEGPAPRPTVCGKRRAVPRLLSFGADSGSEKMSPAKSHGGGCQGSPSPSWGACLISATACTSPQRQRHMGVARSALSHNFKDRRVARESIGLGRGHLLGSEAAGQDAGLRGGQAGRAVPPREGEARHPPVRCPLAPGGAMAQEAVCWRPSSLTQKRPSENRSPGPLGQGRSLPVLAGKHLLWETAPSFQTQESSEGGIARLPKQQGVSSPGPARRRALVVLGDPAAHAGAARCRGAGGCEGHTPEAGPGAPGAEWNSPGQELGLAWEVRSGVPV